MQHHHKSLPALNTSAPAGTLSSTDGGPFRTPAADRSFQQGIHRTRSGFVLVWPGQDVAETGGGGGGGGGSSTAVTRSATVTGAGGSSFRPRSRSMTLRRSTSDNIGASTRKKKLQTSSIGDINSQKVNIMTTCDRLIACVYWAAGAWLNALLYCRLLSGSR